MVELKRKGDMEARKEIAAPKIVHGTKNKGTKLITP